MSGVPWLMIEYHLPQMLQAALDGSIQPFHWLHLLVTAGLAVAWLVVALVLFRGRGWQ